MIAPFAGLAPHLAEVEAWMDRALASGEPRVAGLIRDLGQFHGKMLRPSLLLMMANAVGTADAGHHRLGAALELIHTATLIHDDLIDDADTRRGRTTAHVRYGNTTAVLLGDYFYTHAFDLVAQLGEPEAMRRLTATTNVICEGELHQQVAAGDVRIGEAEYERIIYGKTACLTELAGELGALRGSEDQRRAAARYGRACGMAFQIIDDCLDLAGDAMKVGKTLCTDLERGRMTLPVIRFLAQAQDRSGAEALLAATSNPVGLAEAREAIIASGALAASATAARAHVRIAVDALTSLPPGDDRDRLAQLAEFIVARDF